MKEETPYSNRELDEKFRGVHEKLDLILTQTTKHNGRMRKLEGWRTGLVMCFSLIILLIPFFVWSFKLSQDNLRNSIIASLQK